MTNFMQSLIYDLHYIISNEGPFLQDFPVIIKRMLQNYHKILKKRTVMLLTASNFLTTHKLCYPSQKG